MKVNSRAVTLLLSAVLLLTGASHLSAGKKSAEKEEAPAVQVSEWLTLGPVEHPLPLFHDASNGGYKLEGFFDDEILSIEPLKPKQGSEQPWFGEQPLIWAVGTPKNGTIRLQGTGDSPQSAWIAAYVTTERWVAAELNILGEHPRAVWLDGKLVVKGGFGKPSDATADVAKKVELTPGKHLLVVRTIRDPNRDEPWSVGASFSSEPGAPKPDLGFSIDRKRSIELRDIVDAPRVTSVAVAPQGMHVAYIMTRVVPGTDESEDWIEIRGKGPRIKPVRTLDRAESISQLQWTDDGSYVSWLVRDGSKQSLFVSDRGRTTIVELLAGVEGLSGYRWVPDSESIVYWVTTKAEKDERGVKRLEGLMDRWANFRDKTHLYRVSMPNGNRRPLTAGELSCEFQAVSADGGKLLFSRQREDLSERPYSKSELWEIDLETMESRMLREFGWLSGASYSPAGDRILIQARPDEFGPGGVSVSDSTVPNSYDTQAFVWDPAGDEVDPISRDFDPSIVDAVWNRLDGRIYVIAEDRDYRSLFRYDDAARSFERIETGLDVIREIEFAPEKPIAIVSGSSAWQHDRIHQVLLDQVRISSYPEQAAKEWFEDVELGSVQPWNFTASTGRTIEGRVYLPPGFDSDKKYPAIVYYYGGTSPVSRAFGGRYPKEWWAARGYVVYTLQPTGATGFGQESSSVHVNDWGKTTAEEIIEGTRKFLQAHPYIDPDRVGSIGASYGGFMTMLLSTKTDLFAAAVSHAGISSLASYWGEGYWGYSYSSVGTADSFPWNRRDIYVDRSPLFRADQAKVPILLTHGRSDKNVPVGESDAFFVALKLLGKSVEYVQIEGEDHWIQDHAKREVWSETIVAWFDRWLKDQPEWWNSLYETDPEESEADD